MKRSTKVLLVYAELRRELGDTVHAGELLELAECLTKLVSDREVINRCGTAEIATPGCMAVDRAFDDGGWELLSLSYSSGMLDEEDPAERHRRPSGVMAHGMD